MKHNFWPSRDRTGEWVALYIIVRPDDPIATWILADINQDSMSWREKMEPCITSIYDEAVRRLDVRKTTEDMDLIMFKILKTKNFLSPSEFGEFRRKIEHVWKIAGIDGPWIPGTCFDMQMCIYCNWDVSHIEKNPHLPNQLQLFHKAAP